MNVDARLSNADPDQVDARCPDPRTQTCDTTPLGGAYGIDRISGSGGGPHLDGDTAPAIQSE